MSMSIRQLLSAAVIASACVIPAYSQDNKDSLAALATNKTLNNSDRAKIETEIIRRAQKLNDAATPDQRKDAKEALEAPPKIAGATPAFLEFYSAESGAKLAVLTGNQKLELALDAVLVLVTLDHEGTAEGLAAALSSPHRSVRFKAVRGIQMLQKKLKSPARAATVLSALGSAGASENDELVLERIQLVLAGVDTKFSKEAAAAWAALLQGRVNQLGSGGRLQKQDVSGIQAAARCFGSAAGPVQTTLATQVAKILDHSVQQYFDPNATDASRDAQKKDVIAIETALHEMMAAVKITVPKPAIADGLPKDGVKRDDAQKALDAVWSALGGQPLNVKRQ